MGHLEVEGTVDPMDPNRLLVALQASLSVFPDEVNESINTVLESVNGMRADPWSLIDCVVQPLMTDAPPLPVQIVISTQSAAALLGSLQARFDDLRAQLPVAQADQLDALRAEARVKWLSGLQRLRREHGGPTGQRG